MFVSIFLFVEDTTITKAQSIVSCQSNIFREQTNYRKVLKILQYLFVKAKKTGVDAVIPIWPNNNYEPLQAIYKSDSFLPLAENALKRNMLSILDVVKGLKKIIYIPVENLKRFDPNLLTFFNINTKKDLEKAAKIVEENLFSI